MPTNHSWLARQAGILLPVSSLPSKYGIGSLGKAACDWAFHNTGYNCLHS